MSKKNNPFKYEVPKGYVALGGTLELFPNNEAEHYFFQNFGNYRYVYNQFKDCFDTRYKNNSKLKFPGKTSLYKLLTQFKQEKEFLKLSDSTALQFAVDAYSQAQWDFMTHKTIKQGKPRFKSRKYYKQAFTIKNNKVVYKKKFLHWSIQIIDRTHVSLPKIGLIRTSKTDSFKNMTILRATISWRHDTNKFWISFNGIKPKPKHFKKTGKVIGLDLGLGNEWIVGSDGSRYSVPDTKYAEQQMEHWQSITDKRVDRIEKALKFYNHKHPEATMDKYSYNNWQRTRLTKSKWNIKIHNIRLDKIRQVVHTIVKNYDVIVIEDLKIKNLMKNHHLAKAIANASWYTIRETLKYECKWYGKKLIIVPPQYTSRICSNCKKKNPEFTGLKTNEWLAVREWTCPFCHAKHDRDINAAINILNRGLALI